MDLIPPACGRSYKGACAGTLHSFADVLLTDGAEAPESVDNAAEFGRPAVLQPVIAPQLLTPGVPALPPNEMTSKPSSGGGPLSRSQTAGG